MPRKKKTSTVGTDEKLPSDPGVLLATVKLELAQVRSALVDARAALVEERALREKLETEASRMLMNAEAKRAASDIRSANERLKTERARLNAQEQKPDADAGNASAA